MEDESHELNNSERTPSPPPSPPAQILLPGPQSPINPPADEVLGDVGWGNSEDHDDNQRRSKMLLPSRRPRSSGKGARLVLNKKQKGMMGVVIAELPNFLN